MKLIRQTFLCFFGLALVFSSCSIDKRQHLAGYHIDWKGKSKKTIQEKEQDKTALNGIDSPITEIAQQDIAAPIEIVDVPTLDAIAKEVALTHKASIEKSGLYNKKKTLVQNFSQGFNLEIKERTISGSVIFKDEPVKVKTDGRAIFGFIAALAGLIIFAIPFGILAVIFSGIALSRIKKSETYVKGKGLAIAGLIIGFIDIIAGIYIISMLA